MGCCCWGSLCCGRRDPPFYLGWFEGRLGVGDLYLGLRDHCAPPPIAGQLAARRKAIVPHNAVQLRSIRNKIERRPPIFATRSWPRWSTMLAHPCSATRDASITSDKVATDLRVFVLSLFRERRELVYRAFHPVAGPVGASRVDRVVVRRPRLETINTHSEDRVRVGHVQPDRGFGRLTEVLGIRAVVHDAEVFRRARRCGALPPDDCRFFRD